MINDISQALNRGLVSLKIDDVKVDSLPTSYSFVLFDSIHNFYSKAKLYIDDTFGNLNEYISLVNGTKIEISFGESEDNLKTNIYRVVNNSTPEQNVQSAIGGKTELSLIHDYYYTQSKISNAFDLNISDIVKRLVKKYPFYNVDIDDTLNNGIWYQPYITDSDFMVNYLLPYAYSTQSNETPFYMWIDNFNRFHFKNYKSMFNNTPKLTYNLNYTNDTSSFSKDKIQEIRYAQESVSEIKPYIHRIMNYWDKNGDFIKLDNDSYLTDFPKNVINPIPLKENENLITKIEKLYNDDIFSDETKNNRKGLEINALSKAILTDKILLSVNFNNDICSGDLIKLNLPSSTSNKSDELSLRNSGDYLVESTYQKWSGSVFQTILICSKQDIKVTEDYRNVKLILNRGK